MNDAPNEKILAFCTQLVRINGTLAELFKSGNLALIGELNAAIKELHAVQSDHSEPVFEAVEEECKVIYVNSDMVVKLLRTTEEGMTEDGMIDAGAQKALNKFLHNIDEAVVNIAGALGIV